MATQPTLRRILAAPGVSLPYLDAGARDGFPVVLVHGLGDSMRAWGPVLDHLPGDVRALVPTLRGHGDADRPGHGYAPADFAGDLAALLDGAGVRAAALVGHSSGVQTALRFALTWPDRTRAVVGIGTPGPVRSHPDAAALDAMFDGLADPVEPSFARGFLDGHLMRPVPPGFIDALVAETLKVPARVLRETWAGIRAFDVSSELHRIAAPVLLIWGDRDAIPIASRQVQEQLVAALPDARLVVVDGAGHHVHWDEPERVAREIVAFIRAVLRGQEPDR
jgi:non-heme chloroperoxidase